MVKNHKIAAVVLGFTLASSITTVQAKVQTKEVWTKQGWTKEQADTWYELSQGSRLIPRDWFLNLIDIETDKSFADKNNMARFGYPFRDDKAQLPVGFVMDKDNKSSQWLGLNCAACHTSRLRTDKGDILIHGGQSFGNFRQFLTTLTASVRKIADSPVSIEAFFKRINGRKANAKELQKLTADLKVWIAHRGEIDRILEGTEDWGPGRADAVAFIQAAAAKAVQSKPADNVFPANAPVNYPHVWNANQQERLQHNGLVSNGADLGLFKSTKIGAYIRNYTEALGVFAEVSFSDKQVLKTSIKVGNLLDLERTLSKLKSPRWQTNILGKIDPELAEQGAELFKENCASCHATLDPDDLTTALPIKTRGQKTGPFIFIQPVVDSSVTQKAQLYEFPRNKKLIGTDPMMVCNFLTHTSPTGKLNGKRKANTLTSMKYFDTFRPVEMTTEILAALIVRGLKEKTKELVVANTRDELEGMKKIFLSWFDPEKTGDGQTYSYNGGKNKLDVLNKVLAGCANFAEAMYRLDPINFPYPGYKTRPLNGIWASPPYLHNGSVPTIFDLLSAQKDRPNQFRIGDGWFDSKKLGLASIDDNDAYLFRVFDDKGAVILGNWNGGHEYGTTLSDTEKWALIEYLKGL